MELTIHDVKRIEAKPIKPGDPDLGYGPYQIRRIVITDKDGRELRLTLFSHEDGALGVRSVE